MEYGPLMQENANPKQGVLDRVPLGEGDGRDRGCGFRVPRVCTRAMNRIDRDRRPAGTVPSKGYKLENKVYCFVFAISASVRPSKIRVLYMRELWRIPRGSSGWIVSL